MRARSRQRSTRARGADAEGEHEAAGLEGGTDLCWGGTLARVHLDSWGLVFQSVRTRHQLAIFLSKFEQLLCTEISRIPCLSGVNKIDYVLLSILER